MAASLCRRHVSGRDTQARQIHVKSQLKVSNGNSINTHIYVVTINKFEYSSNVAEKRSYSSDKRCLPYRLVINSFWTAFKELREEIYWDASERSLESQ